MNSIKDTAKINLVELRELLGQLSKDQYTAKCKALSNASIGQHFRHIIEFYGCLKAGYDQNRINYDARKRNQSIETCPLIAVGAINELLEFIEVIDLLKQVNLEGNFSKAEGNISVIPTNYGRELAYNIEHSIHHQALIRIGLMMIGQEDMVSSQFGVAPATIRYREN